MRRLPVLLVLAGFGCGGAQHPGALTPQTPNEALSKFLDAVKANDLTRMGNLWGSERGPASTYMDRNNLKRQLTTIQIYWNHTGYRIIEGPLAAQPMNPTFKNVPSPDRMRDFRIDLQRASGCSQAAPITVVRTNSGGWLVYDVHLEAVGSPAARCQPSGSGTRP
jgi:hypothetical protein